MSAGTRAPQCADCPSALKFEYEQPLFSVIESDGRGVCGCARRARAGARVRRLHAPARSQRSAAVYADDDGDATTPARANARGRSAAAVAAPDVAAAHAARATGRERVSAGDDNADA